MAGPLGFEPRMLVPSLAIYSKPKQSSACRQLTDRALTAPFVPRRGAASIPNLRIVERAWLAGIVEGEGSLGYSRAPRRNVWRARLAIEMTDKPVVERCALMMGTSVFIGHRKRRSFETEAWGERCLRILQIISPHFAGSKRELATKVLTIGPSVSLQNPRPIIQRRSPEFAAQHQ